MSITKKDDERLALMLKALEGQEGNMSDWQNNFIADQRKRHARFKDQIYMSDRQWGAIEKIYEEVTGQDAL